MAKKKKLGRNSPCPCGSGKKFKKCCSESTKHKRSTRETVSPSTWDYANRWVVNHKGKEVTTVRQMPVTIDRETGERLAHPYVAQMHVDGKTVKALTRPEKIAACRTIAIEQLA
jgi:hypothetical protein